MRKRFPAAGMMLAVLFVVPRGFAEIVSFTGSASASITELVNNVPGDTDTAFDGFPVTTADLPLQVVTHLVATNPELAAGQCAAQFADPRTSNSPNPEEFAINLALNSSTAATHYEGNAQSQEIRTILFSPAELGNGLRDGDTATLEGRLFLDGALAMYANDSGRDLSGGFVTLTVRVEKIDGEQTQEVFFGAVGLTGAANGNVQVTSDGAFPTSTLILSDLSAVSDVFGAFRVLIIPPLNIPYNYAATVGRQFTLRATVRVDARNVGGDVGVAGLVGTPVDALQSVIDTVQGAGAGAKTVALIRNERNDPTGVPAFKAESPLAPLCGLFGIELPLLAMGLIALRFCRK